MLALAGGAQALAPAPAAAMDDQTTGATCVVQDGVLVNPETDELCTLGEETIAFSGSAPSTPPPQEASNTPPPCPGFGCLRKGQRQVGDPDNLLRSPDGRRAAQGKGVRKLLDGGKQSTERGRTPVEAEDAATRQKCQDLDAWLGSWPASAIKLAMRYPTMSKQQIEGIGDSFVKLAVQLDQRIAEGIVKRVNEYRANHCTRVLGRR
jgi:hypothetical protein